MLDSRVREGASGSGDTNGRELKGREGTKRWKSCRVDDCWWKGYTRWNRGGKGGRRGWRVDVGDEMGRWEMRWVRRRVRRGRERARVGGGEEGGGGARGGGIEYEELKLAVGVAIWCRRGGRERSLTAFLSAASCR
jgi:hypothetical protein